MSQIKLLSVNELKTQCPFKWHDNIPDNGISFGVADVDFEGPAGINEFLKSRLDGSFSFYQAQVGMDSAFDSIENYFETKQIQVDRANIQIIPGTMMGIYAAMKYASRREGKIVVLGPIYEPIHKHATDNNNPIEWINIDGKLDIDLLNENINSETKMIAICNPTNPIGYNFSKPEIKAIRDIVIDNDIVCFSDELYEPLVFNEPLTSVLAIEELRERSICLYGFSKAYGLAGYRSGFMYAGTELIDEIRGITNSLLISPNPIASLVCEYALSDERSRKWVRDFRDLMSSNTKLASRMFRDKGYECITPSSCFFVFPNLRVNDVEFVPRLLENQGVQVAEGQKFGSAGKGHVRINCGTSEERLVEGITRIFQELEK
ncbi:MAG: pyridoxal phosphate-dependent aminotransferase [Candidatus Kariarchaeaceae archaeon]